MPEDLGVVYEALSAIVGDHRIEVLATLFQLTSAYLMAYAIYYVCYFMPLIQIGYYYVRLLCTLVSIILIVTCGFLFLHTHHRLTIGLRSQLFSYNIISKVYSHLVSGGVDIQGVVKSVLSEFLSGDAWSVLKGVLLRIHVPYMAVLTLSILMIGLVYPQLFNPHYLVIALIILMLSSILGIAVAINEVVRGGGLRTEVASATAQSLLMNIAKSPPIAGALINEVVRKLNSRRMGLTLLVLGMLLTPVVIRPSEPRGEGQAVMALVIEHNDDTNQGESKNACLDMVADLLRKLGGPTFIQSMTRDQIEALLRELGYEETPNSIDDKTPCEYKDSELMLLNCLGSRIIRGFINAATRSQSTSVRASAEEFTAIYLVTIRLRNVRVSELFEYHKDHIRKHEYRIRGLLYEVPCSGDYRIYVIVTTNNVALNLALARALSTSRNT